MPYTETKTLICFIRWLGISFFASKTAARLLSCRMSRGDGENVILSISDRRSVCKAVVDVSKIRL